MNDRNPPPSNRQLLILLGLFIGFIVGVIWLGGLLVNSLIWLIPPSVEQQLAAIALPAYEQLAKPSPTQDELNQLLDRLETHLPPQQREQRDYRVWYIEQDTVNALALPGDRLIIYSGLLKQMHSENELMMILGHELGHFANRDHLRSLARQLVIPITLAAIFGDTSGLQAYAINIVNSLSNAKFSQSQESQADQVGLELLQANYGHVAGATDFFTRLSQKKDLQLAFLATHPAPSQRVKEIERMIKQRSYPIKKRSPLLFNTKSASTNPVIFFSSFAFQRAYALRFANRSLRFI